MMILVNFNNGRWIKIRTQYIYTDLKTDFNQRVQNKLILQKNLLEKLWIIYKFINGNKIIT